MKDFIDTHFDELLLFIAAILGGILYWYRPETKDFVLGALVGAFIMSLKDKRSAPKGQK